MGGIAVYVLHPGMILISAALEISCPIKLLKWWLVAII